MIEKDKAKGNFDIAERHKMTKYLKGKNRMSSDIILNLKRISIGQPNSYSSSSCGGPTSFYFDCETKHGYMEDPDMGGEITVLDVEKQKDCYVLKVKFKRVDYD